ncbi:MAG: hypothetical protein UT32_C0027G0009 [Parcubacteria group bacterium GW2011_GWC2_39_14]|nr:MAG: hypothetical protein UT32_C0027G0009 [Parcubacteria group bacterium GW2011_GWC2_39_14]
MGCLAGGDERREEMLHFLVRLENWLKATVFKGARAPEWFWKEVSDDAATGVWVVWICVTVIWGMCMGLLDMRFLFAIGSRWASYSLAGWIFVGGFLGLCGPVFCKVIHCSWQLRHHYVYIYRPKDISRQDLFVKKMESNEPFSDDLGVLYAAIPKSRLFGKVRMIYNLHKHCIRVRLVGPEYEILFLKTRQKFRASQDVWLALIGYAGPEAITNITDLLIQFKIWQDVQMSHLKDELLKWQEVLRASKKAAGSQELKALAERMEYVNSLVKNRWQQEIGVGDAAQGVPQLIMPKPKTKVAAKKPCLKPEEPAVAPPTG